jgi:hypothetical protein
MSFGLSETKMEFKFIEILIFEVENKKKREKQNEKLVGRKEGRTDKD